MERVAYLKLMEKYQEFNPFSSSSTPEKAA